MTTKVTTNMLGRSGRIRTVLLTLGIALLGMTLPPPAARAETNQGTSANAVFQAALCKAGGGTVVVVDMPGWSTVSCYGGVYDGMSCYNGPEGVFCTGAFPKPTSRAAGSHIWQPAEVIPVLESGTPEQITQMLTEIEAANEGGQDLTSPGDESAPVAAPSVVNPDDKHQNTGKSKSKKGKGKKIDKGRK